MLCDCILTNEKLVYQNADFWIESFNLIKRIIGGVDYKGVREIMKVRIINSLELCFEIVLDILISILYFHLIDLILALLNFCISSTVLKELV